MQTAQSCAATWALCVFTVLFLGERQRAAKLKQSHRVIIFSHVCCGLVQTPSLHTGKKELQHERRTGTKPEDSEHGQTHHYRIRYSRNYNPSLLFVVHGRSHFRTASIPEEAMVCKSRAVMQTLDGNVFHVEPEWILLFLQFHKSL